MFRLIIKFNTGDAGLYMQKVLICDNISSISISIYLKNKG